MSDSDLKPCPSCGYAPVHCGGTTGTKVDCYNCGMSGPRHENQSVSKAAWNSLPRRLRWTTIPPTEPGWYWYRLTNGESLGDIVLLYDAWGNGRLCVYNRLETPILLRYFRDGNVEWAGPIPKPEEPQR